MWLVGRNIHRLISISPAMIWMTAVFPTISENTRCSSVIANSLTFRISVLYIPTEMPFSCTTPSRSFLSPNVIARQSRVPQIEQEGLTRTPPRPLTPPCVLFGTRRFPSLRLDRKVIVQEDRVTCFLQQVFWDRKFHDGAVSIPPVALSQCAGHVPVLTGESPITGIYRQV